MIAGDALKLTVVDSINIVSAQEAHQSDTVMKCSSSSFVKGKTTQQADYVANSQAAGLTVSGKTVWKMKLLMSGLVTQRIIEFAKQFGEGGAVFEELKIIVHLGILSLIFFQPERYSQSIACHFKFTHDVEFFFEDVWPATEGG